ncbi:unnamed protein product [Effrenium voratum]|uniref:Uncharacterized protein n=1 Tax=Effrenium voratum TaxID=2562239 RepID=A0AA36NIE2_9DINO|nr:unnamed protein product [Effrenium voratum]
MRTVADPELPDDKEERLFFTMINCDVSSITELKRITQLEMEGCIDKEGLKEFTKGGGVLDPAAQLKIVDFTGRAGAEKLANAAGSGQVDAKQGKGGKPKKEKGESGSVPKQVNHAFRLQPLKMSSDLISQLLAVGVKLESLANQLQENIKKGKDKNRYYVTILTEVDKYSRMARERIELGKALVRAAEKAANPKAKPAAKPAKNATGEPA